MTDNRVRCRPIGDADLEAVADLLARGFPGRTRGYFLHGLHRVRARKAPDGLPQYGYMLERGHRPVGAVLLIFSRRSPRHEPRCNIASWYVEPQFRMHAAMLSAMALKHRDVTYLNVTPAPNTWPILEAQGYRRYCDGLFVSFPALAAASPAQRVEMIVRARDYERAIAGADLPEREIEVLREAADCGCTSAIVRSPDGMAPFVFLPFRVRSGRIPLPAMQLVYARAPQDFIDCAGALGRPC